MLEFKVQESSDDVNATRPDGKLLGCLRYGKIGEEKRLLGFKPEVEIEYITPSEKDQISAEMSRRGIFSQRDDRRL